MAFVFLGQAIGVLFPIIWGKIHFVTDHSKDRVFGLPTTLEARKSYADTNGLSLPGTNAPL